MDSVSEEIINQKIVKSRILVESILDVSKKPRPSNVVLVSNNIIVNLHHRLYIEHISKNNYDFLFTFFFISISIKNGKTRNNAVMILTCIAAVK